MKAPPLLYPLTFQPVLKDYIWGGRNLERLYGRHLPPGTIAESWEIAGHEDGTTIVDNGPYAGMALTELQAQLGLSLIGRAAAWAHDRGKFPLLIKLLDAHERLSVQVHPNDDYAQMHEGNELGKSEMWLILHAEPGAAVILGVKAGSNAAQFRQAIHDGTLANALHHIPVQRGDFVCVPAGSLHAILGGLVIAEIQQNSNTTYRVYDWHRRDSQGQARPLHVDKALAVINFDQVEPVRPQPQLAHEEKNLRRFTLCQNEYFTVERVEMGAHKVFYGHADGRSLEIWGTIEGTAVVSANSLPVWLTASRFTLLPAALGHYAVTAGAEGATLLRAYL
jgi:mannose-6-phosphate isomerase